MVFKRDETVSRTGSEADFPHIFLRETEITHHKLGVSMRPPLWRQWHRVTYFPSVTWSGCSPHIPHFPLERECTEHSFASSFILSSPSAIPEFHKKLSLLAFWMKCTGPSGVYHTSADKMMKQLDINFAATVNEECPGLAETGTSCCCKEVICHQKGEQFCTGLYSAFIALFSNPWRSVWAWLQDVIWKLIQQILGTILAWNNQIGIGEKKWKEIIV